jgi:hypothetical protein
LTEFTPASKEVLLRSGLSKERIAAMEPWRANAISAIDEYWRLESEIWKCWMLPGKQAAEEHAQAVNEIRALQNSGEIGLLVRLLPGLMRAKAVIDATNRRIDGLRIAEAMRAEGVVPERLPDLHLPLPTEGQWGGPLNYRRDGTTGILDMTLDWDPQAYPLLYRITVEQ